MEEQRALEYKLYPNPVSDALCLETNEMISCIENSTLDGKVVFQQKVENKATYIDVYNLVKGLYLYTIKNQNGINSSGRFIKQ